MVKRSSMQHSVESVRAKKWVGLGARAALLLVGAIWGRSLIVVKSAAEYISPNFLIALRFTAAFAVLALILRKRLRNVSRSLLGRCAVIGACLFLAYWIQTIGVTFAMPGKSAFLSSIYCVLVPFIYWLISGQKPKLRNLVAAALCVAGIVLTSMTGGFTMAFGDVLALLSGVFFAAHIAVVGKLGQGEDPIVVTILQFGFCSLFAWIATFALEGLHMTWDTRALGGVLYLTLFCTTLALLLQNVGQKYASPASASILMSTESVFGILFSVLFAGEVVTARLAVGFALIFAALLVSEVQLPVKQRTKGYKA